MAALPYSPLFRAGDWCCISGQIGIDDGGLVEGFEAQLHQIFSNLDTLLDANDVRADQIARTTVFLIDMADYAAMNKIYGGYFGSHLPARSAVAVAELPFGARVELEAWLHDPA